MSRPPHIDMLDRLTTSPILVDNLERHERALLRTMAKAGMTTQLANRWAITRAGRAELAGYTPGPAPVVSTRDTTQTRIRIQRMLAQAGPEGVPVASMAAALGITTRAVRWHLTRLGAGRVSPAVFCAKGMGRPRTREVVLDALRQAGTEGACLLEMARDANVSTAAVHRHLRAAGARCIRPLRYVLEST